MKAVKYYPAGATTNSASGVTDIRKCDAVLEAIYAAYQGRDANGIALDTDASVRRYFAPALAALIIKDRKQAAEDRQSDRDQQREGRHDRLRVEGLAQVLQAVDFLS